jgi:hypothetical protein
MLNVLLLLNINGSLLVPLDDETGQRMWLTVGRALGDDQCQSVQTMGDFQRSNQTVAKVAPCFSYGRAADQVIAAWERNTGVS